MKKAAKDVADIAAAKAYDLDQQNKALEEAKNRPAINRAESFKAKPLEPAKRSDWWKLEENKEKSMFQPHKQLSWVRRPSC